jgi:asparagine synthase (glutamine-hydrolysing)
MCGITGYILLDGKPVLHSEKIIRMLQVQKHRGPDDSGIRAIDLTGGKSLELPKGQAVPVDRNFNGLLGFNRLSIMDLSLNGHQPMVSPDEKVILMMNGEIYNAFDFKNELNAGGYAFKSTSDTEVVLALYLKYGIDGLLARLNGMFAIVIADLSEKRIYLARDRFGIKPLYYFSKKQVFAFSSELKSFRHLDSNVFELDENKLDEYLLFRNNINGTLFRRINIVKPGEYLICEPEKEISVKRFFHTNDYLRQNNTGENINGYLESLEKCLSRSIKRQLMSDVKLGCQLSGGVDSSLVTWYASQHAEKGKFDSVSIIFKNEKFSEAPYINKVADQLDILSHQFELDPGYYLNNIEKATWHLEIPVNHPNTIGIYLLSKCAREHVTVLLSGEGADEVFGGYSRYYDIRYPYLNRRFMESIMTVMKDSRDRLHYLDSKFRAILATAYTIPSMASTLYPAFNIERAMEERLTCYERTTGSVFTRQVKYEMQTYLPDLLIRQDKMSMAHTIENRVPLLDNEVVDQAFAIPEEFLIKRRISEGIHPEKYILKKLAAQKFGNDFSFRQKMGFGVPMKEFLFAPDFYDYICQQIIPGIQKRGLMNHHSIQSWMNKKPVLSYQELETLWIALSFEIWANRFLDHKTTE